MFARFDSISLTHKIALSLGLFLIPLAFTLYLLVSLQNRDITFAAREVAGTSALAALDRLQSLANAALLGRPVVDRLDPGPVDALAELGLQDEAAAAMKAVRAAAAVDRTATVAARSLVRDLQASVGDRSNLILDNVLETYYLTDVVLNRLPDLIDRLTDIGPLAAARGQSPNAEAQFLMTAGGLSAVLDGLDISMKAAFADNATGSLRSSLADDYLALYSTLRLFGSELQAGSAGTAAAALVDRTAKFTTRAEIELHGLLNHRVSEQRTTQRLAIAAATLAFLMASGTTLLIIHNGVVRPVNALCGATQKLAEGDLHTPVPHRRATDQVGRLGRDISDFRERLIAKHELEADRAHEDARRERRYIGLGELARDFNASIGGQLDTLNGALGTLRSNAEAVASRADSTAVDAGEVGEQAGIANQNTQTVAAATEELDASSGEIAHAVERSAQASAHMRDRVSQAVEVVSELTVAVGGMASLVGTISNIAGQTNLLALNATIEAARAGEAGRGFAVVATEVRALASATARATEEISERIAAIRSSTSHTSALMTDIGAQVETAEETAAAIAAAVAQQGGATAEITRSVLEVATCMRDVASRMDRLGIDAPTTKMSSAEMLIAFRSMSAKATDLQEEVQRFILANGRASDRRSFERRLLSDHLVIRTGEGRSLEVTGIDISEGGIGLRSETTLSIGTPVTVVNLGSEALHARVVASGEGLLRLQFRPDRGTETSIRDLLAERFLHGAKFDRTVIAA